MRVLRSISFIAIGVIHIFRTQSNLVAHVSSPVGTTLNLISLIHIVRIQSLFVTNLDIDKMLQ